MLVLGAKEVESNTVSVRSRKSADIVQMSKEKFAEMVKDKIDTKSID